MKKIIEGKRYDTETATQVAEYGNGLGEGDFSNYDETLYRTPRGNWFLSGEGGPMTKYSRPCGDMTSGGDGIIPLSSNEARQWLESHDENDALEKYFSDALEDA